MSPKAIEAIELKPLLNHIYEYKKGVRKLILHTLDKKYQTFAEERLCTHGICYYIQSLGDKKLNLFFGTQESVEAISLMVTKPLNMLSPEEDFILGALLGYDLNAQCHRYKIRKKKEI